MMAYAGVHLFCKWQIVSIQMQFSRENLALRFCTSSMSDKLIQIEPLVQSGFVSTAPGIAAIPPSVQHAPTTTLSLFAAFSLGRHTDPFGHWLVRYMLFSLMVFHAEDSDPLSTLSFVISICSNQSICVSELLKPCHQDPE